MRLPAALVALLCSFLPAAAGAAQSHADRKPAVQRIVDAYLASRGKPEHISAVSVSVSFPGDSNDLNVVAGRTSLKPGAPLVTPQSLFQIGSNTKAFTAVALLQLEAEGKLSLAQTVGDWLPQYPAWRSVTIRRLLNMTSGIAGYDNVPAMASAWLRYGLLDRRWTDPVLVGFADPTYPGAPKPTHGWNYSNTNYILAGMIVERVTGRSYAAVIAQRFFGPKYGLQATYYSPNVYPRSVRQRMVSGYFWNTDPGNEALKPILGVDVRDMDMSWAASAGGIVARPQDVAHWARALYKGGLLPPRQRRELESIISNRTGKPIVKTSPKDPLGFGLGVGQLTKVGVGTLWYYQGETLGYRVVYFYSPAQDLVLAVGLNSQPSGSQNKVGSLMESLYRAVTRGNSALVPK